MQSFAVKCSNEKCDSRLAWMYQLQTRSADEPPTTFYKVSLIRHKRSGGS